LLDLRLLNNSFEVISIDKRSVYWISILLCEYINVMFFYIS